MPPARLEWALILLLGCYFLFCGCITSVRASFHEMHVPVPVPSCGAAVGLCARDTRQLFMFVPVRGACAPGAHCAQTPRAARRWKSRCHWSLGDRRLQCPNRTRLLALAYFSAICCRDVVLLLVNHGQLVAQKAFHHRVSHITIEPVIHTGIPVRLNELLGSVMVEQSKSPQAAVLPIGKRKSRSCLLPSVSIC
jgi:hypothetical protein